MTVEQENAEIREIARRRVAFDAAVRVARELEERGAESARVKAAHRNVTTAQAHLAELFGDDEE